MAFRVADKNSFLGVRLRHRIDDANASRRRVGAGSQHGQPEPVVYRKHPVRPPVSARSQLVWNLDDGGAFRLRLSFSPHASWPWPYVQRADIFPMPRSGMAERGRRAYVANGCFYCHSQQIRADYAAADVDLQRWAAPSPRPKWADRRSAPRDYIFDRPALIGKVRLGPDLANIGKAAPAEEEAAPAQPAPAGSPGGSPAPANASPVPGNASTPANAPAQPGAKPPGQSS